MRPLSRRPSTLLRPALLLPLAVGLWPALARASDEHADAVVPVLLALVLILLSAKAGGELAVRLNQPSVLGELAAGIALGALFRAGAPIPDLAGDVTIDLLARLGVLVLLFEVGLESTVPQMLSVGPRATMVALVGVAAPIVGGWATGRLLMPDSPWAKHLFLGAALCATSVGITARVFKDMAASQTKEARIVLGAAVIDDVLGLVVLAVVSGVAISSANGAAISLGAPLRLVLYSAIFLAGSIVLGPRVSRLVFRFSTGLRTTGVLLPLALAFAFLMAALANWVQLAPIVGAYAAGLMLERAHYKTLVDRGEAELEELIHPIGQLLVPIFFVVMGARVDLRAMTEPRVLLVAGALSVVAVLTKLACGLVLPKGYNRLAVGLGMVPRGEVGLIFADAGSRLSVHGAPLLNAGDLSVLIVLVLVTTMATPPLLGWALRGGPPPAEAT
jgi:Kef-type K+ transport system membrane component KefB